MHMSAHVWPYCPACGAGAAGVAVAALLSKASMMRGESCVVVCCGGNVSAATMDKAYRVAGLRPAAM